MQTTNTKPIFIDTETMGFSGPIILIQYSIGLSGDIVLFEPWKNPIQKTLDLIEMFCNHGDGVVVFNGTFDWFHLTKLYNLFYVMGTSVGTHSTPVSGPVSKEFLNKLPDWEEEALMLDKCLKPVKVLDLMLHAQKGPYQKCMNRSPIVLKRVPNRLAPILVEVLNEKIIFDPIMFARRAQYNDDPWKMKDALNHYTGAKIPGFQDVYCSFSPSLALKTIAVDIGLVDEAKKFKDVMPSKMPVELSWAPYANSLNNVKTEGQKKLVEAYIKRKKGPKGLTAYETEEFKGAWPGLLEDHIRFWGENTEAREYAKDDIVYTRGVWEHFGCPELGDDDSTLACCVASVRHKGYRINIPEMQKRRDEKFKIGNKLPFISKPAKCHAFIKEVCNSAELKILGGKTDDIRLERLSKLDTQAGIRAGKVRDGRKALLEAKMFDKLLIAKRFHPSFKVIGTLTSRMSGTDSLNPQGINSKKDIRQLFYLHEEGQVLCGGDFDGFEVAIFEAKSNDPDLRKDLLSGKKVHGLFGQSVYRDMTYDEIINHEDKYKRAKSAVFAMLYGGGVKTLQTRLGVSEEDSEYAYNDFMVRYPGVGRVREAISVAYSPIQESEDGGFKWVGYKEYVESLYGFKRFFHEVDFPACEGLFKLATNPPSSLLRFEGTVLRSEWKGPQSLSGACRSALYGAAFGIQGAVFRQAANHEIQSSGAEITKALQVAIWNNQPSGVNRWLVQPMNVHDEILVAVDPSIVDTVKNTVNSFVKNKKEDIPLIQMTWAVGIKNWSEK